MIVSAPLQEEARNGPRPINLNKDIPQVMKLLEMVFGNTLDDDGQRMLASSSRASQGPSFLWRLNPATGKLALGFVWEDNGRVVGNVTVLTTKQPNRFLVVNVAVHPNYRRRGIARELMNQVQMLVSQRQGNQILLQVVKNNEAALELYRTLNYRTIGSMTAWYSSVARLRSLAEDLSPSQRIHINPLGGEEWRHAYQLDRLSLHPDLNWPEPLSPTVYKTNWWLRLGNFMNGRRSETWATHNTHNELTSLANILSEWGRAHYALLRVHPAWKGQLERPLFTELVHRLQMMPRRNIRIDHPDNDEFMNQLLREANFVPRRTLTHMRFDF